MSDCRQPTQHEILPKHQRPRQLRICSCPESRATSHRTCHVRNSIHLQLVLDGQHKQAFTTPNKRHCSLKPRSPAHGLLSLFEPPHSDMAHQCLSSNGTSRASERLTAAAITLSSRRLKTEAYQKAQARSANNHPLFEITNCLYTIYPHVPYPYMAPYRSARPTHRRGPASYHFRNVFPATAQPAAGESEPPCVHQSPFDCPTVCARVATRIGDAERSRSGGDIQVPGSFDPGFLIVRIRPSACCRGLRACLNLHLIPITQVSIQNAQTRKGLCLYALARFRSEKATHLPTTQSA
ncbi:hypothetical protein CC78DRAFT_616756 [Lojkania enalia]|uniref:Uncharacterized protein n=1 Tax=Lojkania enalia TaxID=147567 RepID=A0A9P4KD68_9PLEO|nr:hypothetical protein CC78DRAFT_616756 [Didymosphaeria enalia]